VPVLPIVPERKKVSVLPGYVLCQERISRLPERAVIPRQVNHLQSIAGAHAAQHSVAIGSRDPKYDANVNVVGMLNVLEAAVGAGLVVEYV